jgi:hypothetical protein
LLDVNPDEPPAPDRRPAYIAVLPVVMYALTAIAFLLMAVFVSSIVAASLFATAAIASLAAGIVLGLSMWVFPELLR